MAAWTPRIHFDGDLLNGTSAFPTFTPGQPVSGKVLYSVAAKKDIDEVTITLKGKCFTWIKKRRGGQNAGYHVDKEKIELFRYQQTLFRGPYSVQGTDFEWPFSFQLPETTSYIRDQGSDNVLYNANPQPLPPSVDVQEGGMRASMKAIVSYELKVKINPNKLLHSEKVVQPLIIIPLSRSYLPRPISTAVSFGRQEWSSSQLRPEQHTFKQKIGHIFSSDPSLRTPEINFVATAYVPQASSIWQPLSISLSIQHQITGPTDPEKPVLVLEQVVVQLKAYTNLRVSSLFGGHNEIAKTYLGETRIPGQHTVLPLDNQPIQVTENLRLADCTREVWRLAPSFSTYTINQSYSLKIMGRVQHPETRHVFNFEAKIPFEILPMDNPSSTIQTPPPESMTQEVYMAAPTYELATGPSSPPLYPGPWNQEASFQPNQLDEKWPQRALY
ncbi:hypothetical protein MBLNU459_g3306t1 [Dothideomycetes sp. NU459]